MATINRSNIGNLHDKISVQITKDDFMPAFEKALKSYSKNANVPGFRKGMVPQGLIKKMYGQSVFTDEVLRTAGAKLEEFLINEKVSIFGQPLMSPRETPLNLDMNNPTDVDFEFEIGIKPDFSIPALNGSTPLTRYKVKVSDKLINDEIDRIQKRYGSINEMTKVTSEEEVIESKFVRSNEAGEPNPGATEVESRLLLSQFPEGLKSQIMGKELNDTIIFKPVDVCSPEEINGFVSAVLKNDDSSHDGHFKMTITKIGQIVPRPLDPSFFADVFPQDNITTEEEFRNRLVADIDREFARITQERLNNEIFELLVHQTPIELPVPFLKRWMAEGGEQKKTADQVENEWSSFEHQLRWQLISDQIMQENGVNVSREEIRNDIKGRLLQYFGMENDEEMPWMDSYIQKMEQDQKTMDETFRRLLYDKLFMKLNEKFAITEQEIAEEDFFKLQNPHDAHHQH